MEIVKLSFLCKNLRREEGLFTYDGAKTSIGEKNYSPTAAIKFKTNVHFMANEKIQCNLYILPLTAVKFDEDSQMF